MKDPKQSVYNFTIIQNSLITDPDLSSDAKLMMVCIQISSRNTEINRVSLQNFLVRSGLGYLAKEERLKLLLNELTESNYLSFNLQGE